MVFNWDATRKDGSSQQYDVVFVDQLSVSIPLFLLTNARVLFYCHHPDLLLVQPGSLLKRLYRIPFDFIEQVTTGLSDMIVVNSQYTGSVFAKTFKWLSGHGVQPGVLYPSINFDRYQDNKRYDTALTQWKQAGATDPFHFAGCEPSADCAALVALPHDCCLFVSINRYERKKAVSTAILALKHSDVPLECKKGVSVEQGKYTHAKLLVAGGWDERVSENVEYHNELGTCIYVCVYVCVLVLSFPLYPSLSLQSPSLPLSPSPSLSTRTCLVQSSSSAPSLRHSGLCCSSAQCVWRTPLRTNTSA